MKKIILLCSLIFLNSTGALAGTTNGYVEKVMLLPDKIVLNAKLDTGAATSSLNVKHIKYLQKNGQQWVAFDIYNKHILLKHDSYRL
jgi:hypothetical protein